jgi:hypothetical protein
MSIAPILIKSNIFISGISSYLYIIVQVARFPVLGSIFRVGGKLYRTK